MITLEDTSLALRFPRTHAEAIANVRFHRTLRVPDTNQNYPLPPKLGSFSLRHVDDYADTVPESWLERGGVMMPLYQSEAMWISFQLGAHSYPFAIKIGAGKINAVTGEAWKPKLDAEEQDYLVIPEQPWLDGFFIAKDLVRQFVAMPLGRGYTAEEQLADEAQYGGLQIIAYPMKASVYAKLLAERSKRQAHSGIMFALGGAVREPDMGLAPGGRIRQEIYDDPYGIETWDQSTSSRCFVTLVDAVRWAHITGELPPAEPPTTKDYSEAGLPWFDYYADDLRKLESTEKLGKLKSVAEFTEFEDPDHALKDEDVVSENVVKLGPSQRRFSALGPSRDET